MKEGKRWNMMFTDLNVCTQKRLQLQFHFSNLEEKVSRLCSQENSYLQAGEINCQDIAVTWYRSLSFQGVVQMNTDSSILLCFF